ncbi:4844_t:CDS:10 [Diversispora eburnea]|uniref:4844_t:CDS:1 n=1 Tax=Diversispora eburnea TaxID=1213867 RepID=A0A9N9B1Q5_9GLOM|nr:4844_t:CDS:10 [Diversispora eburnea]
MDKRLLIELLEDLTNFQVNNEQILDTILKKCCNASKLELAKFINDLSLSLRQSPDEYITAMQIFIWHLKDDSLQNLNRWLPNFVSNLITEVILPNLDYSDFLSFRELLRNCVELLWWADLNKELATQTIKNIFSAILRTKYILEILVSETSSYYFFKLILFDFNIINLIREEELIQSMELTWKTPNEAQCSNTSSNENQIGLFKNLLGFLPCTSCHKRALIDFSPDKYSSLIEEDELESLDAKNLSDHFRLPFEFNNNDELGPWEILLSENVIKDLRKLNPHTMDAVMKQFGKIASGEWNKYVLLNKIKSHNIPVFEVKVLDNSELRIIWQVDYGFSMRCHLLTQFVKIWAVTTNQEEICNTLAKAHDVYTEEHVRRCSIKQKEDIVLPMMSYEEEEEIKSIYEKIDSTEMDDERLLEVHKMLVTDKFIPLSSNLLKSLVKNAHEFTFHVSKTEYEIIKNPTSSIVIGRSGTGKTTCIVFRQIASYLTNQLNTTSSLGGNFNKRQLFITVSYGLCCWVKRYFARLRESAVFSRKKMTKAQFNEYINKMEKENDTKTDDNTMPYERNEEEAMKDIPNSFLLLKDEHFPLFITYNKFSKMLMGTYDIDIQKLREPSKVNEEYDNEEEFIFKKSSLFDASKASWAHFIDYNRFEKEYWPHLGDPCRNKWACELIYSEFSVIKGINPEPYYLSRDDYLNISIRKYPVFCHNREEIYDLFERYEKIKRRRGQFDSMDRTLAIFRQAKMKPLGGPQINEVYIDECQDNQIVDLSLILKLFEHADSVLMAGDIAQCIARGSSFRFQDLKTLMYKWEIDRIKTNNNQYYAVKPKEFELNINFRSHHGIIKLASSVTDLIKHFFPDSIDSLKPEHGEVGGPRPIMVKEMSEIEVFNAFAENNQSDDNIDLGAEQVIIVRNEEDKIHVKNIIGEKAGFVMTVYETKGMEFNDVLLYNFFKPARLMWRVILSTLDGYSKGIRSFDHHRHQHYILLYELKNLYVAVTRARQRLWIYDVNDEFSEPIQMHWEEKNLVKVVRDKRSLPNTTKSAKSSNPQEWDQKGKIFLERQQYDQAIFCFEKSKNENLRKVAEAYSLQQDARASIYDTDENKVKDKFIRAACAFEKCFRYHQAVSCYQDIEMHKAAGKVYTSRGMFESAARYFKANNKYYEAGKNFERAKKYINAIVAYKECGSYETAISLMKRHDIDNKIFFRNICHIIITCFRENKENTREKAISILTQEERNKLLKDREFLKEIFVAAENLRSCGKFEEAANMFSRSFEEANILESLQCLLYLCRINVLKNILADSINQDTLDELRNFHCKATNFISNITNMKLQWLKTSSKWNILMEEVHLYSAYFEKNLNRICECIQFFHNRQELVYEFRAISLWLKILPQSINAEYWHERLQFLLSLCKLIFGFIAPHQTINLKKNLEEIFLVRKLENKLKIAFDNPLVDFIKNASNKKKSNYWKIFDANLVYEAIPKFIASYIRWLISMANQYGKNIPDIASEICHHFASSGKCPTKKCLNHHVIPTSSILYKRLSLACDQYTLMRQLSILHQKKLISTNEVSYLQNFWAGKLFRIHFRYFSPQTSCPEITRMIITKLSKDSHNALMRFALINYVSEFGKYIIVSQLKDSLTVHNLYNWNNESGQYGNLPSLLISSFNSKKMINAISYSDTIIYYAIRNSEQATTADFLYDLTSLIEFTMLLILTIRPGYCKFCLPRSYLINYYYVFNKNPRFSDQEYSDRYNKEDYREEIENLFCQTNKTHDPYLSE